MRKPLALCSILVSFLLPTLGEAATLVVDPAGGGDYTTIQTALSAASAGDTVFVRRGTYSETLAFGAAVTLRGEETAGTILTASVTLSRASTLERFTLKKTVFVTRIPSAIVRNNIFTSITDSALKITSTSTVDDSSVWVLNNTFYNNTSAKAVEFVSDSDPVVSSKANLYNNIFSGNSTAVERVTTTSGVLSNNFFTNNTKNLSQGSMDSTNKSDTDPKFVDTSADPPDLHLQVGSTVCNFGAFGKLGTTGVSSSPDTTPAPPFGLTHESTSGGIKLTWKRNLACDSSVSAFRAKWSATPSTSEDAFTTFQQVSADSGTTQSLTFDPSNSTFGTPPSPPTAAPTGVATAPLDSAIQVSWTGVSGAAGYRVKWGTAVDALTAGEADAGNASSYEVKDLTNGTAYYAAVAAYNANSIYVVVTALPETAPADQTEGESRPSNSEQVPANQSTSGPFAAGATSATPSQISGFPDVEDKSGCFVRTLDRGAGRGGFAPTGWALALLAGAAGLAAGLRRFPKGALLGLLAAGALLLPRLAGAEDRPWWAVSMSGGVFYPRIDGWSDNYDKKYVWEGKMGLGFRILRQLEVGVEGGYRRSKGEVTHFDNGNTLTVSTEQRFTVYPVQAYALFQFCFADGQWLVPYVAGGYSRYYYKKEVDGSDDVKGHQDGYHARGGLKILLNALDPYYAQKASQSVGIKNTYLTLEAQYAKVDDRGDSATNLGGMSYLGGFVVEF